MQFLDVISSPDQHRTVFVPYLGDHSFVIVAALRAARVRSLVLPPPNDESLELGMHYCRGRECSPCFTTLGDFIRLVRQPEFDPDRSVLFLPTIASLCRFGQYTTLLRDILNQMGLSQVQIISPSVKNPFQGFGSNPVKVFRLAWKGIVAVDLLQKLLLECRPYETNPGETERVYQVCLEHILTSVERGSGARLLRGMHHAARLFGAIPVHYTARPRVGVVGEVLVRFNAYASHDIIHKLESAGAEVVMPTMSEWIYHTVWDYKQTQWEQENMIDWVALLVAGQYQHYAEQELVGAVAHLLSHPYDTPIEQVIHNTRMVYHPDLDYETVLNVGKAIDYAQQGVSGIVNVMPFSCMPGIITAGLSPRLRALSDHLPWLDITFDGKGETNVNTRIEAFLHQAYAYQRSRLHQQHRPKG